MRYQKIAAGRRGLGRVSGLWLGEDHLLCVESTGYSEEYQRCYLKDIQAIVTQRTSWSMIGNIVCLVLILLSVLGVMAASHDPLVVVGWIFGILFLLVLLVNLWRGPSCRCFLQTATGAREVVALDRIPKVKKALGRVAPLIALAQGELPRQEMVTLAAQAGPRPPVAAVPPLPGAPDRPASFSSYSGNLHKGAFLLMLGDAVVSSLQIINNSSALTALSGTLCLGFLIVATFALVRQRAGRVNRVAGYLIWGGIGAMVVSAIVSYFVLIVLNFKNIQAHRPITNSDVLDMYAAIQPGEHPYFASFIIGYAVLMAASALIGLVVVGRRPALAARGRT